MPRDERLVSAQVMLLSASGKQVRGDTIITAANVAEYAPAPESVERVWSVFAGLGFEVGPPVGNSLSITAPASLFEQVFRVKIEDREGGGLQFATDRGAGGLELPREAIPAEVAPFVAAITFTPPPDFGPTSYM